MKTRITKGNLIALLLLMAFGFFINRQIEIKGLYMDDLYLWSCYGEQSFLEYIFPIGGTRFRFIYYIASWLELWLVENHISWLVPINILLNGLIAWTVYGIGKKFSRSDIVGFLCGIVYLMSRLSYYQISQVYGLMETMALWCAIVILYFLYRVLNSREDEKWYFIGANLLYFAVCFIHERYMALLPLFFLVLLFKLSKRIWMWLVPAVNIVIVLIIRVLTIGTLSPAGTGGTDVADTFHVGEAVKYAWDQVAYVFGISAGPSYLSGLSWAETPGKIKYLVLAADAVLLLLVISFLIKAAVKKNGRPSVWKNTALFLVFIMLCIGSSSVTVRVEMRWVYVSLTGALLLLAYMFGVLTENGGGMQKQAPLIALFALYTVLMFPVETFYRSQFPNLYLWPNQLRYNSLAEETYERYGAALFGKTIYIIGNSYEMSDFTADTFFKVYDRNRRAGGTKVVHIESIRDLGQITDDMLILREDPAHNGFQDITDYVRTLKCESITGYYRDGWMDQHARIRVMAGASGVIRLQCVYPGEPEGGEQFELTIDGSRKETVDMSGRVAEHEIRVQPYQTAELEIITNFYVKDAQEKRGDTALAMLVTITVE